MPVVRENTIFLNFKQLDFHPSELELHRLMKSVHIVDGDLLVLDYHYHTKQAVIKFTHQETFFEFCRKFVDGVPYMRDGKMHLISIDVAGKKKRTVKLRYVPLETNINQIKTILEKYGKVNKIMWEIPQNISNDMLKVQRERLVIDMTINRNIPSFIQVEDQKISVSYIGQIKTCANCDSMDHDRKDCTITKKSFSEIVRNRNTNENNTIKDYPNAVSQLTQLIEEAESEERKREEHNTMEKYRKNKNSDEDEEQGWTQVKKRGRKSSPVLKRKNNFKRFPQVISQEETEITSDSMNDDDEIDDEEERNNSHKKIQTVSKIVNEKMSNNMSLKSKSVAPKRGKIYFKPILTNCRSRFTPHTEKKIKKVEKNIRKNNGTSGFPWPEFSSQEPSTSQPSSHNQTTTAGVQIANNYSNLENEIQEVCDNPENKSTTTTKNTLQNISETPSPNKTNESSDLNNIEEFTSPQTTLGTEPISQYTEEDSATDKRSLSS